MTATKTAPEPATLSVPEAGRLLGIGKSLAYDLARRDEFPVRILRLGQRMRVSRVELDRYLAGEVAADDAA
ncbi:helix-turn-helix domain-containing protein [Micrococcus luteus]|uniref:helix-turn-helix domain-containing protein n=1 Tax=Micrococcus luteus TaxID=1270 RepID=UPI003916E8DD